MSPLAFRVCLGCGCTDETPCIVDGQPCAWVSMDPRTNQGLCTACNALPFEELLARIELQQQARELAVAMAAPSYAPRRERHARRAEKA